MNNLLVKAGLMIAATVGGAFVGAGVKNMISNNKTTTVVQSAVPVVNKASVEVGTKHIRQLDLNDKQVITIYGEIGQDAYYVSKKIIELGSSGKPIFILINSPGGSVLDGALIVSAIEASQVPVYTICEGLCASMAFIIHQYGHKRLMVDRAIIMAHPASGGVSGTLQQMQSRLGTIRRYVDKFDAQIAQRAGLSPEKFESMTVSEMWIDAEDATNSKFNDEIVNVKLSAQPSIDLSAITEQKRKQNNAAREKMDFKW